MIVRRLREAGVLGMNSRNLRLISRLNRRRLYPNVDDKVRTKLLCARAGVPTPALIGVVRHLFELRRLGGMLEEQGSFVVKPARGAQGNGILVVRERREDMFVRSGGRELSLGDISYHIAEVLSGLFSLGGQADQAILEECLVAHSALEKVSYGGVPDIRLIVYRGFPLMAMVRLPTRASGGRANLHQGALGAGVDLVTGQTVHAILRGARVDLHPDTGNDVVGVTIPHFDALVHSAVLASDQTGLGYVGVDLVIDEQRGPVVLEMNARPGLAIQLANREGLGHRLARVDAAWRGGMPAEERVALGRQLSAAG